MAYWDIVTGSFRIAWRHKYLWLIAFFAGEAGGAGGSGGGPPSIPSNGSSSSYQTQNVQNALQSAVNWIGDHIGLIVTVAIALIVLWIALFILAAVCEGATIRASAEHDAERPFGLGVAWRCGVATMGAVLRFRLLIIALLLPAAVILIGLAVGLVVAILSSQNGTAVAVGLLLALCAIGAVVYSIYISFLDRLGVRAIVLEQVGARVGLGRGNQLVRKRFGRVLLVWLLSIVVGIVVGIVVAIALVVIALPLVLIGIAAGAASGGSGAAVLVIVLIGIVLLFPLALVIGGFTSAQTSTYWTLAFRRLDLDTAPLPAGPFIPPARP